MIKAVACAKLAGLTEVKSKECNFDIHIYYTSFDGLKQLFAGYVTSSGLLILRKSEVFPAKVAYNYGVLFLIVKPRKNASQGLVSRPPTSWHHMLRLLPLLSCCTTASDVVYSNCSDPSISSFMSHAAAWCSQQCIQSFHERVPQQEFSTAVS